MPDTDRSCDSTGQHGSISGYCTECFDLIHTRDQCWVYVRSSAEELIREFIGPAANRYRPVCKACYQQIVSDVPQATESARR